MVVAVRELIESASSDARSVDSRGRRISLGELHFGRRQVEEAHLGFRSPDRPKKPRSTVLSVEEEAVVLPKAHAAAARRLPLRSVADYPASDALARCIVGRSVMSSR
jgi:hypothetical protein